MPFSSILLLALALAMDATAVAAARAMLVPRLQARHVLLVAVLFGGFQALMPLLGWFAGSRLGPFVQTFAHWIAFLVLGAIGAKMLWEARTTQAEKATSGSDPFALPVMLTLAVATSIDALAVGVTLPMLGAPLGLSLATIGVTAALLSVAGLFLGRVVGSVLGKRLDVAGGVVLIALGCKVLVEHFLAR